MSTLRAAAADYLAAGLSIFPTAGKKPLCRWREYQRRLPTVRELAAMPWSRATGLGLALGAVSGGLACRDFDDADAYDRFAGQNPWLAGDCPTVKTSRGKHVYFRPTGPVRTIDLDDGELRAGGSYVILPPSKHESGHEYAWLAEPANLIDEAPLVDTAYFLPATAATTLPPTPPPVTYVKKIKYVTSTDVLAACIPQKNGERNKCLLRLARLLKMQPEYGHHKAQDMEPIFRQWHAAALPFIRTKDFAVSWREFSAAWRACRPSGLLSAAATAATATPIPGLSPDTPVARLAALCRALAGPDGQFFLATRDAAKLCGFSGPMQSLRAMQKLAAMGLIALLQRGTQGVTGRANRYRWILEERGKTT